MDYTFDKNNEFRNKLRKLFESEQIYNDLEAAADSIKASVAKIRAAEDLENSGDISFDAHQKIEADASEQLETDTDLMKSLADEFEDKEEAENAEGGDVESGEEIEAEEELDDEGLDTEDLEGEETESEDETEEESEDETEEK